MALLRHAALVLTRFSLTERKLSTRIGRTLPNARNALPTMDLASSSGRCRTTLQPAKRRSSWMASDARGVSADSAARACQTDCAVNQLRK